jgi:hypothetical protein
MDRHTPTRIQLTYGERTYDGINSAPPTGVEYEEVVAEYIVTTERTTEICSDCKRGHIMKTTLKPNKKYAEKHLNGEPLKLFHDVSRIHLKTCEMVYESKCEGVRNG